MNKLNLLLIILFSAHLGMAQMVVFPSNDIPVYNESGTLLLNPWCGGINAANISTFDADFDGEQDDLFVFDKAGDRTLVFEGVWNEGQKEYHYMPEESNQFPQLLNFGLLRDFNCDGKKDIFTYSALGGGFAVYENTSSSSNLSFELVVPLLNSWYPFAGGYSTNIFVSSEDVPAVFDFEGDGDMDILTFGVSGSTVELHLNQGMETQGACSLDSIVLANRCYGKFAESSENNGISTDSEIFDQACSFNVPNPKSNRRGEAASGLRHVGSTILAFDATQDGLADLVIGDVSYRNLTYLENSEGSGVDSVVHIADDFPNDFNAPAVDIDNFPSSFYEDISGDGVRDLIACVNNADVALNRNSVYYYENVGQDNNPQFNFIQDNFLQDGAIEFGESTAPALVDVNGDGLMDIVLGSRGEFIELTEFKPRVSLFLNTGTLGSPEFTLSTEEWIDLNAQNIGQYPDPDFGDLDGDGDVDLVLGDNSGKLHYYQNNGGAGNAMSLVYVGTLQADGAELDVGQKSSPELYDLNTDGLLDLIVGERNGNLNYYENVGNSNQPIFHYVTDTLGGLTTLETGLFVGSSVPNFYVVNGTTYLAAGSESGKIHLYEGIDGNINGDYSLITQNAFNVNTGLMNNPFVVNVNNDEYLDLIVGGIGGGLYLYMGNGFLSTVDNLKRQTEFRLYPNPGQNQIQVKGIQNELVLVEIFTIEGQLLDHFTYTPGKSIDISKYSKGIFLIRVTNGSESQTLKLIKQ